MGPGGTLGDAELDRTRDPRLGPAGGRTVGDAILRDRTGEVELFFESFPPPPTLLIFGAVHVAQALAKFAKQLGFRVIVTDARAKLATQERFPTADRSSRPGRTMRCASDDRSQHVRGDPDARSEVRRTGADGHAGTERAISARSAAARRAPTAGIACAQRVRLKRVWRAFVDRSGSTSAPARPTRWRSASSPRLSPSVTAATRTAHYRNRQYPRQSLAVA